MEILGAAIGFVATIAFCIGIVGILRPTAKLGMPTRSRAGIVTGAALIGMAIAGSMLPQPPNTHLAKREASHRSAGPKAAPPVILPAEDGTNRTGTINRIFRCRDQFYERIVDRDALTCNVLYGREEELADACFAATNKAGDALYLGASEQPAPKEWEVCIAHIEKGTVAPETLQRRTAILKRDAIALKTMAASAFAIELKRTSNDPRSFEIVEAGVTDKSICLTVRGKNAFGALVVQNLLLVGEQLIEAPSPARWRTACEDATDVTENVVASL